MHFGRTSARYTDLYMNALGDVVGINRKAWTLSSLKPLNSKHVHENSLFSV